MGILSERDVEFDVIEYLKTPPTRADLARIVELLPDAPTEMFRRDKKFKELGLDAGNYQTAEAVVDLLVEHPALMQRPIVVKGNAAVIGRPASNIEALL